MPYPFQLRPLPYAYDALCPEIGERTLCFHHDKHLQTYVDNLNKVLSGCPDCQGKSLEDLLRSLEELSQSKSAAVCNNAGGVYNHYLYFDCLGGRDQRPSGRLAQVMDRAFGSFEDWKTRMKEAALGQFGSGYAWLIADQDGAVSVAQTPNQNCPLSQGFWPLLCVDVWEHAYYLDYQNRRGDYVDAWFRRINWEFVSSRYNSRG